MDTARTLAVASEKGGVGKTTLVMNLGLALARRGWRTLIVDTDPQGAVSLSVNKEVGATPGLGGLAEGVAGVDEIVVPTRVPELAFVPVGDAQVSSKAFTDALERVLDAASESRDIVLVDTASGICNSRIPVLEKVHAALVPVQAEPLSVRTLKPTLECLARVHELTGLTLIGVVLTMVQSRDPVSLATVQEIWNLLPPDLVMDGFVPRDSAFLRASAHGVPVQLLSRTRPPAVAAVFDRLAAELETRLRLVGATEEDDVVHLVD